MKLIAFGVLICILSQALWASEIKYLKGQIWINSQKASIGSKVVEGDIVKVDSKSLAIVSLDDGSKIKVNEDSVFKITNSTETEPTTVNLDSGSAFFKIKKILKDKIQKEKFRVKTAQAAMGVRGTEFFVSYGKDKNDDVWMCVNEGIVEASTKKSKTLVEAGQGIKIKKDNISPPKALPWTKKLNWSMDEEGKDVENKVLIEQAYKDILGKDYD